MEQDEAKCIYKVPLKFKPGEFQFSQLNFGIEDESLDLDYNTTYQMLTYKCADV